MILIRNNRAINPMQYAISVDDGRFVTDDFALINDTASPGRLSVNVRRFPLSRPIPSEPFGKLADESGGEVAAPSLEFDIESLPRTTADYAAALDILSKTGEAITLMRERQAFMARQVEVLTVEYQSNLGEAKAAFADWRHRALASEARATDLAERLESAHSQLEGVRAQLQSSQDKCRELQGWLTTYYTKITKLFGTDPIEDNRTRSNN